MLQATYLRVNVQPNQRHARPRGDTQRIGQHGTSSRQAVSHVVVNRGYSLGRRVHAKRLQPMETVAHERMHTLGVRPSPLGRVLCGGVIGELDTLFASLQQQAFRGEL